MVFTVPTVPAVPCVFRAATVCVLPFKSSVPPVASVVEEPNVNVAPGLIASVVPTTTVPPLVNVKFAALLEMLLLIFNVALLTVTGTSSPKAPEIASEPVPATVSAAVVLVAEPIDAIQPPLNVVLLLTVIPVAPLDGLKRFTAPSKTMSLPEN